ncbi:uncharacterized protein LOC123530439 [Mercenaria mercenaria]|uniref:uncharacterized protein LOC123530439 n=1 Tax=Mercenaria mercenaria TaxID=6596 RepID=UPI00234EF9A5|nr:uncharacterized protein LOC123530439 [Mercenaria mercenaria]
MIMDNTANLNNSDNLVNIYFVINSIYAVTMALGIFGNILIVSTILKNKYLRTPMNLSLVSLALCDLIVCACVLPVRLYLYNGTWDEPYSQVLCRVDVFMKSVCDYVQPSMLVATSYERYKSIAKPFQSKSKMKRIVIVITATWSTCLCCGVASAFLFKDGATIYPCNKNITSVEMSTRVQNYREAYVTFPLGFSCIVLVIIFYFLMMRTLHEHTNKMKKQFKAKPFKNKVHPESKTEQSVKKVTNLDTLTIEPLVIENNDANLSDNSRQTSGTSVNTQDSIQNSNEAVNTTANQNGQLLQEGDAVREDVHADTTESNSECQKVEHISPGVTLRCISIRKTRDNILLSSNESRHMRRFSTIAKHVVLIKSHKKRSLNNMQVRLSKNISVDKLNKTSSAGQESKSKQEFVDYYLENETGIENSVNKEVKIIGSETVRISQPNTKKDNIKPEPLNSTSVACANYQAEEQMIANNLAGQTECSELNESKTLIHNKSISYKPANVHVEPCNENSNIDKSSEKTSEKLNYASDSKDENSSAGNSKICITRKPDDDNNDIKLGNINTLPGKSERAPEASEKQNSKNNLLGEKNKISSIDVVDFYGTVHKDVEVEGAVVGAVCVMNTTNRLEGRRKVEMRAAKRIAVMIGSFVLLWLPLPLIALFVSSRRQISRSDIEAILTSASISATTIAFNPILNLLLNKQLRSAALAILRRSVNALKRIRLYRR